MGLHRKGQGCALAGGAAKPTRRTTEFGTAREDGAVAHVTARQVGVNRGQPTPVPSYVGSAAPACAAPTSPRKTSRSSPALRLCCDGRRAAEARKMWQLAIQPISSDRGLLPQAEHQSVVETLPVCRSIASRSECRSRFLGNRADIGLRATRVPRLPRAALIRLMCQTLETVWALLANARTHDTGHAQRDLGLVRLSAGAN